MEKPDQSLALLERLSLIQRLIVARTPVEEILDTVAEAARQTTRADAGTICLLEGISGGPAARALESSDVLLIEATPEELAADFGRDGLANAVYASIHRGGEAVGVLGVAAEVGRSFDGTEAPIIKAFAEHATLAINHAKALDDAAYEAFHDALTSLPNRVLLLERLSRALSRSARLESEVAVLAIDLDRFSHLNDLLGHDLGDQLLRAVGLRLRAALRPTDTVARLGGDLFAVVAEDLGNAADVEALARRVTQAMTPPFDLGDRKVAIDASIGSTTTGAGAAERIRNAEVALQRAKAEGRGRHAVYEPEMHKALRERRRLESEMRSALGSGEFEIHYQPVVELDGGRISGLEALVRWCPGGEEVSPSTFIPLAEETGMIRDLGAYVIDRASRQIALWRARYPAFTDLHVAINLSPVQLRGPDLVEQVSSALRESQLDPAALRFEITETALMGDAEESVRLLERLKALGVSLAIDDFGTGYSSLQYLQRLPVDVLKVDRVFVAGLGSDDHAETIIRAVIDLARAFGLTTVAEGIETDEQIDRLRRLGCPLGQGYLFSRALDVEHADAYLLRAGLIGSGAADTLPGDASSSAARLPGADPRAER